MNRTMNKLVTAVSSAPSSMAAVTSLLRGTSSGRPSVQLFHQPLATTKAFSSLASVSSSVFRPPSMNSMTATATVARHLPTMGVSRSFATASTKKAKAKGVAKDDEDGSTEDGDEGATYFGRKVAAKERRVQLYQHKVRRADQLKHRRRRIDPEAAAAAAAKYNDPTMLPKKMAFRSWWDARRAHEERLDRKARQAGLEWKVRVAVIVERLPVVLPDKDDFERDFEVLQAYLQSHSGKEYPKEFLGGTTASGGAMDRPVVLTDEELMGT